MTYTRSPSVAPPAAPARPSSSYVPPKSQPSTLDRWSAITKAASSQNSAIDDLISRIAGGSPAATTAPASTNRPTNYDEVRLIGSDSPFYRGVYDITSKAPGAKIKKPTTTTKPTTGTKPTTTPKPSTGGFNTVPTSLANLLQQLSANAGQMAMPGGPVGGVIQAPQGSGRPPVMMDPATYGQTGGEATFYRQSINGGMAPISAVGNVGVPDAWNPTGAPKTPITGAPVTETPKKK